MTTPTSVIVVGASAAGVATAETLRRKGYQGALTLLGAEFHHPYDRPPLSKQVLSGTWGPQRAQLRSPEAISDLDATLLLGDPAVALDAATRTVSTASGRELRADAVVVATGARPRNLPGQAKLSGVHALRTLDDTLALRRDLLESSRFVVVGDGVLGAEIAATARGMGIATTLTGPQPAPMASQLGFGVSNQLAGLHTENKVDLRPGTQVSELAGRGGRVTGVRLDTGEELPADVVAVAVGVVPQTGWLEGSGLELDDGVVCDAYCRAAEGIYAVGDTARWYHSAPEVNVRLENRTNATEQASTVAANILGEGRTYTPVPYFWTDQFDAKVQVHGFLPADGEMNLAHGSYDERRFVARCQVDGATTGVVGWNMPKQSRILRQEVSDWMSPRVAR